MALGKDFKVNITRLTTAVSQRGFGTILVLSNEKDFEPKRFGGLDDMVDDFGTDTVTYGMASDLFGQGVDEILVAGADTQLATELVDVLDELVVTDDGFFGVVCTDNAKATITAIAGWVEGKEKVYAVTSDDKEIAVDSNQTLIAYHGTDNLGEIALAYMLTKEIGTVDLDGKVISGITSSEVDATEYGVLKGNNVNVAVEEFGRLVIKGGNMGGGEKVDIVLSEFWIRIRMEEDLAVLKMNTPKIPYTDGGVALLVSVATTRLKMAVNRGIIALDGDGVPEFTVSYIPVADVPESERAGRVYDYVKWTARLSGSIRSGTIYGELTV
jgi:hypothetical protein